MNVKCIYTDVYTYVYAKLEVFCKSIQLLSALLRYKRIAMEDDKGVSEREINVSGSPIYPSKNHECLYCLCINKSSKKLCFHINYLQLEQHKLLTFITAYFLRKAVILSIAEITAADRESEVSDLKRKEQMQEIKKD